MFVQQPASLGFTDVSLAKSQPDVQALIAMSSGICLPLTQTLGPELTLKLDLGKAPSTKKVWVTVGAKLYSGSVPRKTADSNRTITTLASIESQIPSAITAHHTWPEWKWQKPKATLQLIFNFPRVQTKLAPPKSQVVGENLEVYFDYSNMTSFFGPSDEWKQIFAIATQTELSLWK